MVVPLTGDDGSLKKAGVERQTQKEAAMGDIVGKLGEHGGLVE